MAYASFTTKSSLFSGRKTVNIPGKYLQIPEFCFLCRATQIAATLLYFQFFMNDTIIFYSFRTIYIFSQTQPIVYSYFPPKQRKNPKNVMLLFRQRTCALLLSEERMPTLKMYLLFRIRLEAPFLFLSLCLFV